MNFKAIALAIASFALLFTGAFATLGAIFYRARKLKESARLSTMNDEQTSSGDDQDQTIDLSGNGGLEQLNALCSTMQSRIDNLTTLCKKESKFPDEQLIKQAVLSMRRSINSINNLILNVEAK